MRKLTSRRRATPLPSFPTVLPRPLPPGWTEAEVLALLESVTIDDSAPGALDGYVHEAFWRFLHTCGLVADAQGAGLELGANPYFTSLLLSEFTELRMTFANYFEGNEALHRQTLRWVDRGGELRERLVTFDQFNVEHEEFPYPDASFEVVLFCEILEHLLMDPLHTLEEIHRVLTPGGCLVLTTPNLVRLENVVALIAGSNISDPYSGHGPYGRHNREYTMRDLERLLQFAGFSVASRFTADAHPRPDWLADTAALARVADLLAETRADDLGQYLFVVAQPTQDPKDGLPDFLYRSYPPDRLVAAD